MAPLIIDQISRNPAAEPFQVHMEQDMRCPSPVPVNDELLCPYSDVLVDGETWAFTEQNHVEEETGPCFLVTTPLYRAVTCVEVPDEEGEKEGSTGQIDDSDEEAAAPHPPRKGIFLPPPTIDEVQAAHGDLIAMLNPWRKKKKGYKDPEINRKQRIALEHMKIFSHTYLEMEKAKRPGEGNKWMAASLQTAAIDRKGPYLAGCLRKQLWQFIADRNETPEWDFHTCGCSLLDDEDFAQELHLHLQSLGEFITAEDIVHYIDTPEMLTRLK
ncbi:hypothetical protein EDD18DRAFT_1354057 [Armillaria luteobubalina]|uniref:Uncharacterized protein n=1 Tax=Armillaria luteobubalina TaxID=153913 RepID=A0AA39Q3J3_9AGAR|nr:hypothetical protein EDD18DRAFT_1354057 [Armillaria luteobubalina]